MPATLTLHCADYLRTTCPNLRLAGLIASVPRNGTDHPAISAASNALAESIAREPDPLAHPLLIAMDETFRRAGANPKRYAPSSSALVKRIAKGNGLFRINDLVDANNLLSLTLRIPCGIYDRAGIAGTHLTFDLGAPQATYRGIDGIEQRTQGKLLLHDRDKVLGGPHADAHPTRITAETRHILVVLYLPDAPESPVMLDEVLEAAEGIFVKYVNPVVLGKVIGI